MSVDNPIANLLTLLQPEAVASPEDNPRFQEARIANLEFRNVFSVITEQRLKFKRVLGWGGFGVVQLWSILDPQGNPVRNVAVKFPIRTAQDSHREATKWEMHWMGTVFRNLEHFVQLVDINETMQGRAGKIYNNPNIPTPVLVMEALEKCNLYELITWVNEARLWWDDFSDVPSMYPQHKLGYIPNRVLWRFFLCLARAVIGMAYPPNDGRGPPEGSSNQPIREVVNPRGLVPPAVPTTIIHFDLDPMNVLVGNIDSKPDLEHAFSPMLKLADFGLTTPWDNDAIDDEDMKLRSLQKGKKAWYAPEQKYPWRCLEWYYHIGHELNVWAIGLTMFNLLTLKHPTPICDWVAKQRRITIPPFHQPKELWTWAWFLLPAEGEPPIDKFYEAYDWDLRVLIARCMADDTAERPNLSELYYALELGIIMADRRVARDPIAFSYAPGGLTYDPMTPPPSDGDDILRKFYIDYFRDPPIKVDPYARMWSDK
ncbi:kinase-like protein [Annulohypoxylon bovei var. microspora]|nr:kinase-like protein [Annulohypoxylon bovei var. microspora]